MPEVVLRPAEEEDIAEMLALYAPYVVQDVYKRQHLFICIVRYGGEMCFESLYRFRFVRLYLSLIHI